MGNKLMTIMYKCFVACHTGRVQLLLTSCPYITWSAKDGLRAFYKVNITSFKQFDR